MEKNHQMKDKLHTQCELEQDNFGLSNHETCYYQVYNTIQEFLEALEANCC